MADLPESFDPSRRRPLTSAAYDIDPIIARRYQDPYDRVESSGKTHTVDRRQNLEEALRRQGFSNDNKLRLATWLMRCNGHYKDFDQKSWKYEKRKARERQAKERAELAKAKREETAKATRAAKEAKAKAKAEGKGNSQTPQAPQTPESLAEATTTEEEVDQEPDGETSDQIDRSDDEEMDDLFGSTGETPDENDLSSLDEKIFQLRKRLRFWDIINPFLKPTEPDAEFDFCRLVPRKIEDATRIKAPKPLFQVLQNGELFYAEDPNFGLYQPPSHERITEEEKREVTELQSSATPDSVERRIKRLEAFAAVECQFSRGIPTRWEDVRDKKAAEAREAGRAMEGTDV